MAIDSSSMDTKWISLKTKITEWIGEAKNVPEWWTGLLQWKQILAIKHRIIACMY